MKKYFLLTILMWCATLVAQVSIVSHQLTAYAVSPSTMLSTTVINTDTEALDIVLVASLTDLKGQKILTVTSSLISLKSGTSLLTNPAIAQSVYAQSEMAKSVRQSGILPYGEYQFCIDVLLGGSEQLDNYCDVISSDHLEFLDLVNPANGDSILTKTPLLIWTHGGHFGEASESSGYRMTLVEILSGQTAESAMMLNTPLWVTCCLRTHQSMYPASAPALIEGKQYAWQVQRLHDGRVVQTSEVWMFYVPKPNRHEDFKYVSLKKGVNSDVFPVFERLYFRFDEPYNGSALTYKILNSSREEVRIPVSVDAASGAGPEVGTKKTGFNTYELDILQYQLEPGYYTVQIFNDKSEKYELKIKIEQ